MAGHGRPCPAMASWYKIIGHHRTPSQPSQPQRCLLHLWDMNRVVMAVVSKLCFYFFTKWTFDLCHLVFPNSSSFDTTTSSNNAVFFPWITYQVGKIRTLRCRFIAAQLIINYNNKVTTTNPMCPLSYLILALLFCGLNRIISYHICFRKTLLPVISRN